MTQAWSDDRPVIAKEGDCMNLRIRVVVLVISLFTLLGLGSPVSAQLRKLNIAYTATSPYQAPLIIAREAGFFKKHGLDIAPILTPEARLVFRR